MNAFDKGCGNMFDIHKLMCTWLIWCIICPDQLHNIQVMCVRRACKKQNMWPWARVISQLAVYSRVVWVQLLPIVCWCCLCQIQKCINYPPSFSIYIYIYIYAKIHEKQFHLLSCPADKKLPRKGNLHWHFSGMVKPKVTKTGKNRQSVILIVIVLITMQNLKVLA